YGAVYGVQAVLPVMRAQGSGHIISISTGAALFGLPYASIYAATKAAMTRFSESLRYELEESNIHVSVIFPDFTATDLALEVTPDAGMRTRTVRSLNQQGLKAYGYPPVRLQSAEEVAREVLGCALSPRNEVYLSGRIRFGRLLRSVLPWAIEREARMIKRAVQQFVEKVAQESTANTKTPD
ncbi:MAG: SDR family NAD(P)-dependent oxidoreductase, partial [Candidatus Binatota bacterium]